MLKDCLQPELSIVIPAFNEETRLPSTLESLTSYLKENSIHSEILVVVEKSTDKTLEVARSYANKHNQIRVIDNKVQRGKGYAIRCGVLEAKGRIILNMDADLSVPTDHIGKFLSHFAKNPDIDVIIANRQHPGSLIEVRQGILREYMGRCFNLLVRLIGLHSLKDTQCGFKAFRRLAAREIYRHQTLDGFACDVEVLLLAQKLEFKTQDLPVRWINSPDSRVKMLSDSLVMLIDILRTQRLVTKALNNPSATETNSFKTEAPRLEIPS